MSSNNILAKYLKRWCGLEWMGESEFNELIQLLESVNTEEVPYLEVSYNKDKSGWHEYSIFFKECPHLWLTFKFGGSFEVRVKDEVTSFATRDQAMKLISKHLQKN